MGGDAVLVFLQSCGGQVRNSDLLLHFRPFLRGHPDQVRNRELFKKFVNSVATVTKIDGVSNVVLRKKFKGHVPGAGAGPDSPEPRGTSPAPSLAAPGDSERKAALPAAAIVAAESGAYLRQVEHLRQDNRTSIRTPSLSPSEDSRTLGTSSQNPSPDTSSAARTLFQTPPKDGTPDITELSQNPVEDTSSAARTLSRSPPENGTLPITEPSLLNRQDFISGFTVLHWIAKHGDRAFMAACGLSFDVNAKSTAGQTPLHVAAIHGNKKVIWLLVKNFGADVKLRDTAGKKAWQYLSDAKPDILQLLGAPAKATLAKENAAPDWKPQKERRRLRHHFSSASPSQRPRTVAQMVKVSRSSSIAALLKHKSHRF
uniref:SOWAHA-C winged helix-turn-helix domain-containing protein n=1 Tax=Fundulus heteroclitus TaxID=8078 RepID=A0A3Q2PKG4_FUNHE